MKTSRNCWFMKFNKCGLQETHCVSVTTDISTSCAAQHVEPEIGIGAEVDPVNIGLLVLQLYDSWTLNCSISLSSFKSE